MYIYIYIWRANHIFIKVFEYINICIYIYTAHIKALQGTITITIRIWALGFGFGECSFLGTVLRCYLFPYLHTAASGLAEPQPAIFV